MPSSLSRGGFAVNETLNAPPGDSRQKDRHIVLEIESEGLLKALASAPDPTEAVRRNAEELACQAAIQMIEKDLPARVEPACSPSPLDRLPDALQQKAPTLHSPGASAWLI